jgi:hypothetical protein
VSVPVGGGRGRSGMGGGVSGDATDSGGDSGPRSARGSLSAPERRELNFVVRWQSALPVRPAIVRREGERMTEEQRDSFLVPEAPSYVIAVSGLAPELLRGASPEVIKSTTILKRGRGEPISVESIQVTRGERPELYFIFPRPAEPITDADKTIEFITTFGKTEVKRRFNLRDMVFNGKLEL